MFGKKEKNGVVYIKNIQDLKLSKIKPQDLTKIYRDETGQEYKLKYNPVTKQVEIVKIIKGVLDGKFIKEKYDKFEREVESKIKVKMSEISSEYFKTHPQAGTHVQPQSVKKPADISAPPQKVEEPLKDIGVNNVQDVIDELEKIKVRLQSAERFLFDSRVFDPRFSYDNKVIFDEISRAINIEIIQLITDNITHYNDILEGKDDIRLKSKILGDKEKEILKKIESKDEKLKYLRHLESCNLFKSMLNNISKTLNDLKYKTTLVSSDVINSHSFLERQKYNDALLTFDNCLKDFEKIKIFLTKWENLLYKNYKPAN